MSLFKCTECWLYFQMHRMLTLEEGKSHAYPFFSSPNSSSVLAWSWYDRVVGLGIHVCIYVYIYIYVYLYIYIYIYIYIHIYTSDRRFNHYCIIYECGAFVQSRGHACGCAMSNVWMSHVALSPKDFCKSCWFLLWAWIVDLFVGVHKYSNSSTHSYA